MDSDCPKALRPECATTFTHIREVLELQIMRVKELADAYGRASDKALRLQAIEYGRRLDGLNGEQARLAADRAHSVSRDLFDSTMIEWRMWREGLEKRVAERQGTERGISIAWAALIGIVPTAIAIAAVLK